MAARLIAAVLAAVALFASGCATCARGPARSFSESDRFAFRNELNWSYAFDESGRTTTRRTSPPPTYTLHCFPMARAAREFFYHARFEPDLPKVSPAEYRRLAEGVIARDSRCPSEPGKRIVIPGYASLAEFSGDCAALLQQACGAAWNSYAQRGNWRMVFPFTRRGQAHTAEALEEKLGRGLLPIVHVVNFPKLGINHAVLLTNARREGESIEFTAYDPNNSARFAKLWFDREAGGFQFERNDYFAGGAVKVYEVYRNALF